VMKFHRAESSLKKMRNTLVSTHNIFRFQMKNAAQINLGGIFFAFRNKPT
jgi:hypothetical protein